MCVRLHVCENRTVWELFIGVIIMVCASPGETQTRVTVSFVVPRQGFEEGGNNWVIVTIDGPPLLSLLYVLVLFIDSLVVDCGGVDFIPMSSCVGGASFTFWREIEEDVLQREKKRER